MKLLEQGIFEVVIELYPEIKKICDELNLKTGADVKNFLEDKSAENSGMRIKLNNELMAAEFTETFSSMLVERGNEAVGVGAGDDASAAADLLIGMFYAKLENLKDYLKNKSINFNELSFDDKFKEFQKTILLESDVVKTGLCEMFVREFGEIENDKDKKLKKPTPQIQPGSGEE